MSKVLVIKIGGSTLGTTDTPFEDAVELQKQGRQVVIVHGGGKAITDWLTKLNIPAKFVNGERVTDRQTLDVAIAVLAGLINKEIVSAINNLGGRATGISGADGLVQCRIKNPELGYVGTITGVNTEPLTALLKAGFIPVIATVCTNEDQKTGDPPILNVNADLVAGEIAKALKAERLIFLTDVDGIHDNQDKILAKISAREAESIIDSGVASGGMIPKIKACLIAVSNKASTCIIDGRQPHVLLHNVNGKKTGTVIE